MTFIVQRLHSCDHCGKQTLDVSDVLCPSCKARVITRSKQSLEKMNRDSVCLVSVKSVGIFIAWQDLPLDLNDWKDSDWEPIGLRVETLTFHSDYVSSRYGGTTVVAASCSLDCGPLYLPESARSLFRDFGAALLRGLVDKEEILLHDLPIPPSRLHTVKLTTSSGHVWTASVSAQTTEEEAIAYFMGQVFDISPDLAVEKPEVVVRVEYTF